MRSGLYFFLLAAVLGALGPTPMTLAEQGTQQPKAPEQAPKTKPEENNAPQKLQEKAMPDPFVEQEMKRLRSLLSFRRTQVELREREPERDPKSIGALAGIGFEAENPKVSASVYIFKGWGSHKKAVEELMRNFKSTEGIRILHGTNGGLLFFGHTRIDGPDGLKAKYRLSGLISAFSGDE